MLSNANHHAKVYAANVSVQGFVPGRSIMVSSMNLRLFGAFPYWNGIIRLGFVELLTDRVFA